MGTGGHPDNVGYPYSAKAPWKDIPMVSEEMADADTPHDVVGHGTLGEFLDVQVEASEWDDAEVVAITDALSRGEPHMVGGGAAGLYRMRRVESLDPYEAPSPGPR